MKDNRVREIIITQENTIINIITSNGVRNKKKINQTTKINGNLKMITNEIINIGNKKNPTIIRSNIIMRMKKSIMLKKKKKKRQNMKRRNDLK